ncbi:cupin domain-containing protein [Microvirga sp. 0TCS3.31]
MREHIDFVQAQYLPWQDAAPYGQPAASLKLLSEDADTGAFSAVLQLPPGWAGIWLPRACDYEIYVLDGAAQIGAEPFIAHDYAFFPNGYGAIEVSSDQGCVMLFFRSDKLGELEPSMERVQQRLVQKVRLPDADWDGDLARMGLDSMKAGSRMRVLRQDPESGETTYVTATFAFRRGKQAERHPIAQEFYLLSGELAGPLGIMQAGAYCIRPPMAKHGPYGSPTGALILFRGFGGEQATYWEDTDPFTYEPAHQPILPERLQPYSQPYERVKQY